ncbi:TadE/TadG family type IV pilus assembly protein [Nocardioides sp. GY 10127]|uniref:TadE/TadG family type IV pilus assembly protein n=1 Tax=Nocardioides sp. GY 10127 TaxID=2569762 RepID=UPI0010A8AC92|nr:TadE/TadG family type IV pilus assembly protein [Nocardioides sp. GY 10127]TIC81628.1 pilus assembly protein [Nocardioides sp. GY 10127]
MSGRRRGSDDRGSAVVDFVLVLLVVVPLFLGILQLALTLFVRNTLASAASDGARYGAALGRGPGDAVARTREQATSVLPGRYAQDVTAAVEDVDGVPTVVVSVRAEVPALGLGGPSVTFEVSGHAVQESAP